MLFWDKYPKKGQEDDNDDEKPSLRSPFAPSQERVFCALDLHAMRMPHVIKEAA
jgi:hypothetical protein